MIWAEGGVDMYKNLKTLRESLNLTQADFGASVGVAKSTYNNYETGVREPKSDFWFAVAQKYKVTIDYLMGYSSDPHKPSNPPRTEKNAPSLSDEALKVAQDYSDLDQPGKNVVRVVIAEEGKRVQADRERRSVAPTEPSETRLIPLYYTPAAAGMMEPAAGEDFDYLEVGPEVPRKADCAIKISGDSMEPYIRNGSIVYVTREPLENGDVGIFYVDGDMLCKQYYRNEKGNVHLISLNRNRADADRFIHAKGNTDMAYYGRVILPRKPIVNLA